MDVSLRLHVSCVASISLEDWVLNAHWLSDETQICLVTAHNVAWLWSWSESNNSLSLRADCSEKCILYPSSLILSNLMDFFVA